MCIKIVFEYRLSLVATYTYNYVVSLAFLCCQNGYHIHHDIQCTLAFCLYYRATIAM